jgi:hypothetical protein
MQTLAILQLVNSENIIGMISNTVDETITIEYPMSLMLDPMSGGLGMMPYLAIYTGTIQDEKIISKKHILGILEEKDLTPEIANKYHEYKKQVLDGMKEDVSKTPSLPGLEDENLEDKEV